MKRAFQKCSQIIENFEHVQCIHEEEEFICVVEGCAHCVLQYNKCFFQKESAAVVTFILLHCCVLKCVYCMLFGQLQQLKVKKTQTLLILFWAFV